MNIIVTSVEGSYKPFLLGYFLRMNGNNLSMWLLLTFPLLKAESLRVLSWIDDRKTLKIVVFYGPVIIFIGLSRTLNTNRR
jgi:hypothetical protein